MAFHITIGSHRLTMVESVTVARSVENLADTATITLPGAVAGRALEIESKVAPGDAVCVRFGYDAAGEELPVEFEGYVESVATDDGSITVRCEDELYNFRRDLRDGVMTGVSVGELMRHVCAELGGFEVACDYDFRYDRFTIYNATGFDVLRKVQQETRANIYLRGRVLHIHPQYAEIGRTVVYDFARNIEKSELRYVDASKRKLLCTIEGTDAAGRAVKVTKGTPGGDRFTLSIPGVSDRATLERRADEELKARAYSGYEGTITGWLVPRVEPADLVEIRDADYEYKTGRYYAVAVERSFSEQGGECRVTLGKRIG